VKKSIGLNIVCFFITISILLSGNFAFAMSHFSCKIDGNMHHECEMECCESDNCCSDDNSLKITSDDSNCCEIHSEVTHHIDYGLMVFDNSLSKMSAVPVSLNDIITDFSRKQYLRFSDPNLIPRQIQDKFNLRI